MILELGGAFVIGILTGKGIHLLAHDRCTFLHRIAEYGEWKMYRCTLSDEHRGPHRISHPEGGKLLDTVQWVKNDEFP